MKFAFFLSGWEQQETGAVIPRNISSRWRAAQKEPAPSVVISAFEKSTAPISAT
jgi:hypothetical protein